MNPRQIGRRVARQLVPIVFLWRRGLPSEVAFWDDYLRARGGEWPDDYTHRFTRGSEVSDPLIVSRLPEIRARRVAILDVGAGPASSLGSALSGRDLDLVPIDPLADEYARLLARYGIEAPVPVLSCRGEDILARFGPQSFDIAYSRNALDHSATPAVVLRNMFDTVRPGGFVVVRSWRNEGKHAGYEELHQWNVDVTEGELVLWNRRHRYTLAMILGARDHSAEVMIEGREVHAVIRRGTASGRGR
jgi:SAM-dependent methyltransferase